MSRSKNFSVYLLKVGFNAQNSLKEDHNLILLDEDNNNIPQGGSIYYEQYITKAPWWKEYWGIHQNMQQTSVSAIVFLPVNERCFAITFGVSYHNLKDDSYEHDFGIRTTLNTLDPEKIKSTDILIPETAKRQRIQIPTASSLTYFDFNTDESIVKRLTGAVKEEYRDLLHNATGSSNLRFTTTCEPYELSELCANLLNFYLRRDYEHSFPELHNIIPIRDPELISMLENQLLIDFHDESINLTLCIPDIVDYSTNFRVKYRGSKKISKEFEDVYIANYREFVKEHNLPINISLLSKHSLCIFDENGSKIQSFSIYKSLLYDCTCEDKTYHLCDGCWYEVNTDFINRLKIELDPIFVDTHDILCECNKKNEDDYNNDVQQSSPKEFNVYCLDKSSISPSGTQKVEPCDLIAIKNNMAELIHNKISTRSASLSHLFNQGVNSVILLRQNEVTKNKLKELVLNNSLLEEMINNDQYCVTYGIISNKNRNLKSDALPLFSRISLLRCLKTLKLMKIATTVFLIKDNVDRKKINYGYVND